MQIHGKSRGSWMTRMKWNEAQPPEELTDTPKEARGSWFGDECRLGHMYHELKAES